MHEAETGTTRGTFELLYCVGAPGRLRVAVQGLAICADTRLPPATAISMVIEMAKSVNTPRCVFKCFLPPKFCCYDNYTS